jgi:hypothetical protein
MHVVSRQSVLVSVYRVRDYTYVTMRVLAPATMIYGPPIIPVPLLTLIANNGTRTSTLTRTALPVQAAPGCGCKRASSIAGHSGSQNCLSQARLVLFLLWSGSMQALRI